MFYLDTSVLVAMFTREARTGSSHDWARRNQLLAVSDWVTVELRSAVAAKARSGDLDEGLRQEALEAYQAALRDEFLILDLNSRVFAKAAKLAGNVAAALRAGDALHLAVAGEYRVPLATLDRRQAEAGQALGVEALLL